MELKFLNSKLINYVLIVALKFNSRRFLVCCEMFCEMCTTARYSIGVFAR